MLVQVDEFQKTVQRWLVNKAGSHMSTTDHGVTDSGFCEVLQGSTAMSRGVVILTGTGAAGEGEQLADTLKRDFPAVYRRIHCQTELPCMSPADICSYFEHFLRDFVPQLESQEWNQRAVQFLSGSCWSEEKHISLDMLKQYLMNRITKSKRVPRQVGQEQLDAFFSVLCDKDAARAFLNLYAPHSGAGEPVGSEQRAGRE